MLNCVSGDCVLLWVRKLTFCLFPSTLCPFFLLPVLFLYLSFHSSVSFCIRSSFILHSFRAKGHSAHTPALSVFPTSRKWPGLKVKLIDFRKYSNFPAVSPSNTLMLWCFLPYLPWLIPICWTGAWCFPFTRRLQVKHWPASCQSPWLLLSLRPGWA